MKACPQCGETYDDDAELCSSDRSSLILLEAQSDDPMIGKLLAGRYRLLQKIAEGGMGSIYRAVHTEMGRTCAIKLLTSVSPGKEDALARFKREAKMASRIDNSHAVTIYDFGAGEDGTMFLAMEFIDGVPLSKLIAENKKIPVERVVHIASQIAEGLTAAHALEIVHRDLKPDNIMITRKGSDSDYVKVLDFGIAKTIAEDGADQLTKTGFVLGTPVYMSPEQLLGEKLDPRSDIYSLAIIVYEMLSGRLPFEGENPQAVMMKRILTDPISLSAVAPEINESVEHAVMHGLARDREGRTPTVEAFGQALRSALMGRTHAMDGRVTGRIDEGATSEWAAIQTQAGSGHAATEVAHSVMAPQVQGYETSNAGQHGTASNPANGTESDHTKRTVGSEMPESSRAPNRPSSITASTPSREIQAPARENRGLLIVGLVVLLGIAAVLYLILPLNGGSYGVTVRGVPAGASVYINDKMIGTAGSDGSLSIAKVEPGTAHLAIRLDGYSEFKADLEGKSGESKTVTAALLPLNINLHGEMVLVPGGEFEMGDDSHEDDEKPMHRVNVPAFYIDRFEVTNRQYKEFCKQTGHSPPQNPAWDPDYFNKDDYPVSGVQYDEAVAYAAWAGKRLLTEAEWEKAASWDPVKNKKQMYPWGDAQATGPVNVNADSPAPVGSSKGDRSAYGVYDMAGNVAEWLDGTYSAYPGGPAIHEDSSLGLVRSAFFQKDLNRVSDPTRASRRNHIVRKFPAGKSIPVGIRCGISADAPGIQQHVSERSR